MNGTRVKSTKVLEYHARGTLRGALEQIAEDLEKDHIRAGNVEHLYSVYSPVNGFVLYVVTTEILRNED